jgi:hypothetical protein
MKLEVCQCIRICTSDQHIMVIKGSISTVNNRNTLAILQNRWYDLEK